MQARHRALGMNRALSDAESRDRVEMLEKCFQQRRLTFGQRAGERTQCHERIRMPRQTGWPSVIIGGGSAATSDADDVASLGGDSVASGGANSAGRECRDNFHRFSSPYSRFRGVDGNELTGA